MSRSNFTIGTKILMLTLVAVATLLFGGSYVMYLQEIPGLTGTPGVNVQQLQQAGLLVSALVLVAGSLIVYLNIVRPIKALLEAVRRITAGELDAPLPSQLGQDEVVEMAEALAVMVRNLVQSRKELEAQNLELQAQKEELEAAHQRARAALVEQAFSLAQAEELQRSRQRLFGEQEGALRDMAAYFHGQVQERLFSLKGHLQELLRKTKHPSESAQLLADVIAEVDRMVQQEPDIGTEVIATLPLTELGAKHAESAPSYQ